MTSIRKAGTVAVSAIALGTTTLAFTPPASAAAAAPTARNGTCEAGEFCYYFNSDNEGSVSDFSSSVSDYGTTQPGCYDYKGPGAGKGKCIKNDAASVWNRSSKTVRVHFNSGYQGPHQDIKAGAKGNLNATLKNNNASHKFVTPLPPGTQKLSWGLYRTSGGTITCGFDGYTTTPGRHEGIDIARGVGSDVKALVSGTVTYVHEGAAGSGGLSTIAVYNASLNKTVIYLHSNPRDGVSAGDSISRGEAIADESWRGISSSSAAHTHVEMRPGRQTHASKSVDDPHLDNPNPTSFWRSQGYDSLH